GRMRPKTSSGGILSTNCKRPVSTRRLTRMLVPKPKSAFQSPGVQSLGPVVPIVAVFAISLIPCSGRRADALERPGEGVAVADPAEDAALGLDHLEADAVEFREVGGAGVAERHAAVAA